MDRINKLESEIRELVCDQNADDLDLFIDRSNEKIDAVIDILK